MTDLVERLRRYSHGCILDRLDPDFADAVLEAADEIEELQQTAEHYKGCSDDWYREACDYKAMIPRWIPVTERLPETSGVYLAWMQWDLTDPDDKPSAYPIEYDAEEEAFGWWRQHFDPESLGWAGEDFIRYGDVTHWMPLPEPPKEER